jgi:glycosyltransferase involved in cell wall biosynthesis
VREWIDDKANGLLCDPADPQALAVAMLRALCDTDLREKARRINRGLILERAEYNAVMQRAETFYSEIVNASRASRLRRLPQAS